MPGTKYKGEPDLTELAKWKKALLMIKAAEAKRKREEQDRFDLEKNKLNNKNARARLDLWKKQLAIDLNKIMKKPKKPVNQDRLSDE